MSYESSDMRDARIDVAEVFRAVTQRLPRILMVTLVLLAVTFILMLFVPRQYESSSSILVESRSNVYSRAANEQAPVSTGNEAGVVSSQIELIKSRDTLLKVIDELDLRSISEFNGAGGGGLSPVGIITQLLGRKATPTSIDETVLGNLNKNLTVSQERDSRIISIQVLSTDPQRAADIANAIARAHVARRAQLSLSDTAEASEWLRSEIERLRQVVNEAETAVANFKVDNDLFIGSNNTSLLDQQLSAIASQISAAQERKSTAVSRAEMIRGMLERGQSIEGVADVRDSAVIQRLSEQKAGLQGEKAQRSATLLSSHPVIRALTAQIAELDNQIALEGRRVANALEAEAQIEADLENSLKLDLTSAKVSASTATQDTVTLDSLQREAKAQRDLLEGYLQRYNEAFSRTETSSALPDVRVVSVAAPSVVPASPKTQLILLAVGIIALTTQVGIVVFGELMSGRAIIAGGASQQIGDERDEAEFSTADEPDHRFDSVGYSVEDAEPTFNDEGDATAPVPENVGPSDLELERDTESSHMKFIRTLAATVRPATEPMAEPAPEREAAPQAVNKTPPKPALEPKSQAQTSSREQTIPGLISMTALTADLVLGRTHLVMLAAHRALGECEAVAEELIADALSRGLSVALVDAGSGRVSEEAGLTDLAAGAASFGEVVHKSADNSFAEIPWGRAASITRNSKKPATLIEALGDIYEVVVLLTGRVGMSSALPMFAALDGRVVLVVGDDDDSDAVTDSRTQLLEAGFNTVEVAQGATRVAA